MGNEITVADAVQYFENARVVMVTRENYEEPVGIPQCSLGSAVKAAIKEAMRRGHSLATEWAGELSGRNSAIGHSHRCCSIARADAAFAR